MKKQHIPVHPWPLLAISPAESAALSTTLSVRHLPSTTTTADAVRTLCRSYETGVSVHYITD